MSDERLNYSSYLKVRELLSLQHMLSAEQEQPAHDEMLYIVVHQVYELWFKVVLHEVGSVIDTFSSEAGRVEERSMAKAVRALERVVKIQKLMLDQLEVLETMTPLDFLDFRHLLGSGSGFQSFQNRLLENRLGLRPADRIEYGGKRYTDSFSGVEKETLLNAEKEPSLISVVAAWLERTPFLEGESFRFTGEYQSAVKNMLEAERTMLEGSPGFDEELKAAREVALAQSSEEFSKLLDEGEHNRLMEKGHRRLSHRATLATLFINLYRDEPILFQPFKLIETIMEIDENFVTWRSRHALMVHRMLGRKIGTGASSGYDYLKRTAERYRVFQDFFNISTFLVPRSALPPLPEEMRRTLSFHYSVE
jgi:tryptophan 2,3-dioxygenase